jgi:hypothetical protein
MGLTEDAPVPMVRLGLNGNKMGKTHDTRIFSPVAVARLSVAIGIYSSV